MAQRADARILVADVPDAEPALRTYLRGYELRFVHDYASGVKQVASGGHDLIVAGLHFAGSRMFSFVREVRSMDATPIVCVQILPSSLTPALLACLEDAALALGAQAFVAFDHRGDGETRLQTAVARALLERARRVNSLAPPLSDDAGPAGRTRRPGSRH